MTKTPAIFCAIDTNDLDQALAWVKILAPVTGGVKLGLEFFNSFGPQGVEKIRQAAPDAALFMDLKFHDIPNTVAAAVKTISENLGPAYLNVHASGGAAMMEAAANACARGTKLLAVTVLTSLDEESLQKMGVLLPLPELVTKFGFAAKEAGLAGVVCSAHDIAALRRECGKDFVLMVPGIRPADAALGDQKRVMTPREAAQAGATHLVIGRPITGAKDPAATARQILKDLEQ